MTLTSALPAPGRRAIPRQAKERPEREIRPHKLFNVNNLWTQKSRDD